MRSVLLASILVVALGAAADSVDGGWRTYRTADRTHQKRAGWRTYGVANKTSYDGVWQRGYGPLGYGWYSAYGTYVGSDYSSLGFGYRSRSSGFNFNRLDNYGFPDPRTLGGRTR